MARSEEILSDGHEETVGQYLAERLGHLTLGLREAEEKSGK